MFDVLLDKGLLFFSFLKFFLKFSIFFVYIPNAFPFDQDLLNEPHLKSGVLFRASRKTS